MKGSSGPRTMAWSSELPMGKIFALARDFIDLPPARDRAAAREPDRTRSRAGALSIMDKQARRKSTPPEPAEGAVRPLPAAHGPDQQLGPGRSRRARTSIGGYLFDKPRDVLYELARSDEHVGAPHGDRQPRLYFIRQGEVDDTFAIAEILLRRRARPDPEGDRRAGCARRARRTRSDCSRFLDRARRHHAAHRPALRDRAPLKRPSSVRTTCPRGGGSGPSNRRRATSTCVRQPARCHPGGIGVRLAVNAVRLRHGDAPAHAGPRGVWVDPA